MLGKMEPRSLSCRQYVVLEHGTCLNSCLGGDISSRFSLASMGLSDHVWPLIYSLPCHHDLCSFDVKYCQVHCRGTDMFKRSWPLQNNNLPLINHIILIQNNLIFLCLVSMTWETLCPTFDQGHFLSTSAHYPRSWSRDSLQVPWSLHASMVGSSCSTRGFHHWPLIEWFCGCSTPAHWFAHRRLYL